MTELERRVRAHVIRALHDTSEAPSSDDVASALGSTRDVGDGWLDTHSPQSGDAIRLTVRGARVAGHAIVHFLVPARRFWDDIGFT